MPSLDKEGLTAGARQAAEDGSSFDEYCELIAKVIISGQTKDQVKLLLQLHCLDIYFESDEPRDVGYFDIRNFKTTATKDKYGGTHAITKAFQDWLSDEASATRLSPEQIAYVVHQVTCYFLDTVAEEGFPFYEHDSEVKILK